MASEKVVAHTAIPEHLKGLQRGILTAEESSAGLSNPSKSRCRGPQSISWKRGDLDGGGQSLHQALQMAVKAFPDGSAAVFMGIDLAWLKCQCSQI